LTHDGEEALETLREAPDRFGLLVTDYMLPSVEGDRLARDVHEIAPSLPVILCTGYQMEGARRVLVDEHISKVIQKPFSLRELAETLRSVLEERCKPGETEAAL
jgi:CheY-like chemotaxis protein